MSICISFKLKSDIHPREFLRHGECMCLSVCASGRRRFEILYFRRWYVTSLLPMSSHLDFDRYTSRRCFSSVRLSARGVMVSQPGQGEHQFINRAPSVELSARSASNHGENGKPLAVPRLSSLTPPASRSVPLLSQRAKHLHPASTSIFMVLHVEKS